MRIFNIAVLVFFLGLSVIHKPAEAQEMNDLRKITVSGEGEVRSAPDQAILRFDVVTRDADPETARSMNAQASRDALNAIRDLGIDESKIRMEHLTLMPVREWDPEERKQIDRGFEVSRGASVEIDDLDKVPSAVAYVVQSGANRIGGVEYGLADEEPVRREALGLAVTNASEKAAAMLGRLDETLGRALEVREESVHVPMPIMRASAAMMEKSADSVEPEAYAPGSIEITARVVVTFAIE